MIKKKIIKKLLIVGGTGFLGFHIARRALTNGWEVTSLSKHLPKEIRKLSKVKYILCDAENMKQLNIKLKNNYDFVINASGYVNHRNQKKIYDNHFNITKNLHTYFKKKKISAFIQIGSSTEYGLLSSPHFENLQGKTYGIYSKAKLKCTKYLLKKKLQKLPSCSS